MRRLILLVCLVSTVLLVGCKTTVTTEANRDFWDKFTVIEHHYNLEDGHLYIIYDNDTKVMYYYVESGYSDSISPIYNSDGTIKIYIGD